MMDGFARAQASYDAQMPPDPDECPVCDGAEYDEGEGDCPHGFYRQIGNRPYRRDRRAEQNEDDARDARLDRD